MTEQRCDICGGKVTSIMESRRKDYPIIRYSELPKIYSDWAHYDFCPSCAKEIFKIVHGYIVEHKAQHLTH